MGENTELTDIRKLSRQRFSVDFMGLIQKYADEYPENLAKKDDSVSTAYGSAGYGQSVAETPSVYGGWDTKANKPYYGSAVSAARAKRQYKVHQAWLLKMDAPVMQPIAETHIVYYVEGVIQETIETPDVAMIDRLQNYIFRINESVDLRPCHGTFTDVSMSVVDGVPEIKKSGDITDIQMDSFLLPVLYEDDYDVVAKAILDGFYRHDGPVSGDLLAKEMGLKVIDKRFYNDYENLGLISFDISSLKVVEDDGTVHNLKMMPGEILINKNLTSIPAVRNSTIIHECVHMYLDRHFFFLQKMGGAKFTAYAARKKKNYGWTNSPVDWMELQADKLPAHILMEKEKTTKAIERLMAAHGGKRDFETIRAVIKDLTEEFQVSYSMARNRMVELGHPEAEGTCNFLDGKPVPDHGCSGEWKRGITYSISEKYIASVMQSVPMRTAVLSGRYRFVEHHFCLDKPEFLQHDSFGNYRLTDYARHHIDECCISFQVSGRYSGARYRGNMAARNKTVPVTDKYLCQYAFDAEPGTPEYDKQITFWREDQERWAELIETLPKNLKEALKKVMKTLGITQLELGLRMGISQKQVSRIVLGKPDLPVMVAVCIALRIPNQLSLKLIDLAGCSFGYDPNSAYYKSWLEMPGTFTVGHCNDILKSIDQPVLV